MYITERGPGCTFMFCGDCHRATNSQQKLRLVKICDILNCVVMVKQQVVVMLKQEVWLNFTVHLATKPAIFNK